MRNRIWHLLCGINEDIPSDENEELLLTGYLDSFAIMNVVVVLENEFAIEFKAEDIIPENFHNIKCMRKMVTRYLKQGVGGK